jgi:hypothetical protein
MKFLIVGCLAVLLFSVPQKAVSQSPELLNLKTDAVEIKALGIEREPRYPSVIHLRGYVEISTKVKITDSPLQLSIMVVSADEADYHEGTGEIEARGNVKMTYRDDPAEHRAGNVRIKLEKLSQ